MTMTRPILVAAAAGLMAAATWLLGWWGIPLVAALWGLRHPAGPAALAGLLAWGGLLAWTARTGPLLPYADRLGGVFGLPGWGMLLVTPLYASLLAWSAATLAGAITRRALR